jgi:mRNA-degrading endonuclease RelE of RelBE toxin-antitoxin system
MGVAHSVEMEKAFINTILEEMGNGMRARKWSIRIGDHRIIYTIHEKEKNDYTL